MHFTMKFCITVLLFCCAVVSADENFTGDAAVAIADKANEYVAKEQGTQGAVVSADEKLTGDTAVTSLDKANYYFAKGQDTQDTGEHCLHCRDTVENKEKDMAPEVPDEVELDEKMKDITSQNEFMEDVRDELPRMQGKTMIETEKKQDFVDDVVKDTVENEEKDMAPEVTIEVGIDEEMKDVTPQNGFMEEVGDELPRVQGKTMIETEMKQDVVDDVVKDTVENKEEDKAPEVQSKEELDLVLQQADPGTACKVTFYQHTGYAGTPHVYTASSGSLKRNDDMSSFKVSDGCCVTIYEHYYHSGKNQKFCGSQIWVGHQWNDKVSSFELTPLPACQVTFYQHTEFSGIPHTYTANMATLKRNDDMSSFKISDGCCVTIYEHYNYGGNNKTYCRSESWDYRHYWNDKVSSFRLTRAPYINLGCFKDRRVRAIAGGSQRFKPATTAVEQCYEKAKKLGNSIFGVQFNNKCFTHKGAGLTYSRYGKTSGCKYGRGGRWKMNVYQIPRPGGCREIAARNRKHNCWYSCGRKGGRCSSCGAGGYCCRQGWKDCPKVLASIGEPNYHTCIVCKE